MDDNSVTLSIDPSYDNYLIIRRENGEKVATVKNKLFSEEVTVNNLKDGDELEIVTNKGKVLEIYKHKGRLYDCCSTKNGLSN